MNTLALTVLVHEGPMARSYLAVLQAAGYRVERIVLMVARRDPAHRKTVAPWLPTPLRRRWARVVQDLQMNHWPRELIKRHRAMCEPWLDDLAASWGLAPSVYQALIERVDYKRHADQVDEVFVDGLADPALEKHFRASPTRGAVLFTGGGMVPASLLAVPGCRFIHVHPGKLPHVRGADGLLWSMLLRGQPGATAFFMTPGLDIGDVILAADLQVPPMPRGFLDLDAATAYRMLYAFVDPMLRAVLFRQVVDGASKPLALLDSIPQSSSDGMTFHFMNQRMRRVAYQRLCETASASALPSLPTPGVRHAA